MELTVESFALLHKTRTFFSVSKKRNNGTAQNVSYPAISQKWISSVKKTMNEFKTFVGFKDVEELLSKAELHHKKDFITFP